MNIERKIIIGLIASTEFIKRIRPSISKDYFASPTASIIADWCLEYFDKYHECPHDKIENIYDEKVKQNLVSSELAEEMEDDILPDLSEEFLKEGFNPDPLLDYALKYFQEKKLKNLKEEIDILVEKGDIDSATQAVLDFKTSGVVKDELVLNSPNLGEAIEVAFTSTEECLIEFPGPIGLFWNKSMVRGGFVAFLAPEKRGKSIVLMDAGMRAAKQGRKVAFFQAGDMTRNQMLRRMGIYLVGKTDKEEYTGEHFIPVRDCVKNQLNICEKTVRESPYGVFEDRGWDERRLKEEINFDLLKQAYEDDPDYQPCYNCSEYCNNHWGTPWLKKVNVKLLNVREVMRVADKWFVENDRHFRLSTYPNGTLSVKEIRNVLNGWEMRDGWKPDVVLVDYADLLVTDRNMEERHRQNQIWKDLRGLNQELDCLLLTATQADADSYNRDLLTLKNFSEDKRKYAHCTAFYGLNWDRYGREKKMGLMRINEIILRESEFDNTRCVTILQHRSLLKNILGSYF